MWKKRFPDTEFPDNAQVLDVLLLRDKGPSAVPTWSCEDFLENQYSLRPGIHQSDGGIQPRNRPWDRKKYAFDGSQLDSATLKKGVTMHLDGVKVWAKVNETLPASGPRVEISHGPVKMWVPTKHQAFISQVDPEGMDLDDGMPGKIFFDGFNAEGDKRLRHVVFICSHDKYACGFFNWNDDSADESSLGHILQIIVVRQSQFEKYRRCWGNECCILALPSSMKLFSNTDGSAPFSNTDGSAPQLGTPERHKIGYSRLFCQLMSCGLTGCEWVWCIDDNISFVKMLQLHQLHGADEVRLKTCTMYDAMRTLEDAVTTNCDLAFPVGDWHEGCKPETFTKFPNALRDKLLNHKDFDTHTEQHDVVNPSGKLREMVGNPDKQVAVVALSRDHRKYKAVITGKSCRWCRCICRVFPGARAHFPFASLAAR